MIKFYIALWTSKFYVLCLKIIKKHQDDKPGLLALKIDDKFLSKIKKPDIVIAVTGTNGKTTVTNILSEVLVKNGKLVIYNDWGANTRASSARCLLDGVTLFNKTKVDIAVLETDEISSSLILPYVKPDYLLVTNLFRDSMYRNGHVMYVFNKINKYIPTTTELILNADDPISSMLGKDTNECVYFGIDKLPTDKTISNNIINDFILCPVCNSLIKYNYLRYHHIGNAYCPNCNFKSFDADYLVTEINNKNNTIVVNSKGKIERYPIINDSIFNVYNVLSVITLLKEMGIDSTLIEDYLKDIKIVKSRYSSIKIHDIEINTMVTKGLNSVGTSRVIDYISSLEGNMELIIVIDDTFDNKGGSEAINWIYDVDFELLNKDNIKKIIIGGIRAKDYKLRLLLAGIPDDRIVITLNEQDTYKYLTYKNIDKIYILHEVYYVSGANKIKDNIIKKIKGDIK